MRVTPLALTLALGVACDPPIDFAPTANFDLSTFSQQNTPPTYRCDTEQYGAPSTSEDWVCDTVSFTVTLRDPENAPLDVTVTSWLNGSDAEPVPVIEETIEAAVYNDRNAQVALSFQPTFSGNQLLAITAHDGAQDSPPANESQQQIFVNARPSNPAAELSGSFTAGQAATAQITGLATDPDSQDLQHNLIWRWKSKADGSTGGGVGGINQPVEAVGESVVLPGSAVFDGDIWEIRVQVFETEDGFTELLGGWNFEYVAATVQVGESGDSPPSQPGLTISPATPTVYDTLTCGITTESEDPEGTTVTYSYRWTVDGTDAGISSETVPAGRARHGQQWQCFAVPTDGAGTDGPEGTSSPVTVSGDVDWAVDPLAFRDGTVAGALLGASGAAYTLGSVTEYALSMPAWTDGIYPAGTGAVEIVGSAEFAPGQPAFITLIGPPGSGFGTHVASAENSTGQHLLVGSNDAHEVVIFHANGIALDGTYAASPMSGESDWSGLLMSHFYDSADTSSPVGVAFAGGKLNTGDGVAVTQGTSPPRVHVRVNALLTPGEHDFGIETGHYIAGESGNTTFGAALAMGDADGDGSGDLLIGTPDNGDTTVAWLFHGSALTTAGVYGSSDGTGIATASNNNAAGTDVALLDGGVVIGALGEVRVFSPGPFPTSYDAATATLTGTGLFGIVVEPVGDLDGDGVGDLAVSDPSAGSDAGTMWIYSGADLFAGGTDLPPLLVIDGENVNDKIRPLGWVGTLSGTGPEIVIGAPGFGGQAGSAVLFTPPF